MPAEMTAWGEKEKVRGSCRCEANVEFQILLLLLPSRSGFFKIPLLRCCFSNLRGQINMRVIIYSANFNPSRKVEGNFEEDYCFPFEDLTIPQVPRIPYRIDMYITYLYPFAPCISHGVCTRVVWLTNCATRGPCRRIKNTHLKIISRNSAQR